MKLIIFVTLFVFTKALNVYEEWTKFKQTYNRHFRSTYEEISKRQIFLENLKKIIEHNNDRTNTYKMGINQFTDMTKDEFLSTLTLNISEISRDGGGRVFNKTLKTTTSAIIPSEVDWRRNGAVTEVKDQSTCGSCWSFVTTGVLESHNYIINNELVPLSEQDLIDCSRKYGNYGCRGGIMQNAYKYVRDFGIAPSAIYPYTGLDEQCLSNKERIIELEDVYYTNIMQYDEDGLKLAVATVGPMAAAVDASNFQYYQSGIFTSCPSIVNLNHGLLVVGYGVDENGVKYWLAKNSWGTQWGENGYIRIPQNNNNECGIASFASFPNVKTSAGFRPCFASFLIVVVCVKLVL